MRKPSYQLIHVARFTANEQCIIHRLIYYLHVLSITRYMQNCNSVLRHHVLNLGNHRGYNKQSSTVLRLQQTIVYLVTVTADHRLSCYGYIRQSFIVLRLQQTILYRVTVTADNRLSCYVYSRQSFIVLQLHSQSVRKVTTPNFIKSIEQVIPTVLQAMLRQSILNKVYGSLSCIKSIIKSYVNRTFTGSDYVISTVDVI